MLQLAATVPKAKGRHRPGSVTVQHEIGESAGRAVGFLAADDEVHQIGARLSAQCGNLGVSSDGRKERIEVAKLDELVEEPGAHEARLGVDTAVGEARRERIDGVLEDDLDLCRAAFFVACLRRVQQEHVDGGRGSGLGNCHGLGASEGGEERVSPAAPATRRSSSSKSSS